MCEKRMNEGSEMYKLKKKTILFKRTISDYDFFRFFMKDQVHTSHFCHVELIQHIKFNRNLMSELCDNSNVEFL